MIGPLGIGSGEKCVIPGFFLGSEEFRVFCLAWASVNAMGELTASLMASIKIL